MRKSIVFLCCCLVLMMFLISCGGEESDGGGGDSSPGCSSTDTIECARNFSTCSDNVTSSSLTGSAAIDALCSCAQKEYSCQLSAGCSKSYADSHSHIGLCDGF